MGGKLFFCVKFGSMKPQMKPQIAVIIPSYNRAPLLPRAVDSVLAQSFKAFELIIIDDGSHDHTREVLKPYLSKPGVRVIHSPHQGGEWGSQPRGEAIPSPLVGFSGL